MSDGNDIDPQLRDTVQSSQPAQEYPPPAGTSPHLIRLPPPTSQSPYQQQPPLHHSQDERHDHQQQHHQQQYAPYPQDGAYSHAYYGPALGHQYGQNEPPNEFQAPLLPRATPPGPHYVSTRGGDAKRLRACEACRGLKVRCEPDIHGGACKRCLKAGRKCEVTPPSRKRQKKTDSRVSELEKQLADIQAQLKMSGQTGSESGGEQYGEGNSMQFETPQRQTTHQPPYSQQYYGKNISESHDQSPYASSQSVGQKRPYSERSRNGPVEAPMYGPPSHPSTLPEDSMLGGVRFMANSLDTELAMSLLREYLQTVVPQRPALSAGVSANFELLRRSKPLLFVTIMIIILQTRCLREVHEITAKVSGGAKHEGTAETGNQALHLLSEVAMCNNGKGGVDKNEQNGGVGEDRPTAQKDPAKAFVEKLRAVDEKEMSNERWFEDLLQDFQ